MERDFWDKMAKIGEIFNKCEVASDEEREEVDGQPIARFRKF